VTHEVRLEVFEGPIDLLLHLITRQRVDIYDVSISTITDEYLKVLKAMGDLDLETATSFLVVAATLLELKSIRLLPAPYSDDEFEARLLEERDLLLARLVECATFRDAGSWIQVGLEKGAGFHPREVPLEAQFRELVPDVTLKVTLADITRAAMRSLVPKPIPQLDMSHVQPIKASVRDALIEMISLLQSGTPVSFESLCSGAAQRIDVVVRFLGLLELFKAGAVELSQHDRFGDIQAHWTGEAEMSDILADVEEYSVAAEETS
jgi:segregation and condensation protein A